ncbi:hypothetical protein OGAPHI_000484 [Ogataea philodendri]|uniref:Uncharacterized protein n=1 Tax=Ogataea philodendri TaxID=1378263 RepID=A0A9P8PG10_9ASCO|nr:uncharacterized protein OGAPHI_000484 [Ogataea philodendri]KAH3671261.1 hypothetical protein OGAPHI_000484 [Ogataea philodendri]
MSFKASSNKVSPVSDPSQHSISRSGNSNRFLAGSFTIRILPRKASSRIISPLRAYEILSFQNDKYPSLSFNPISNTSSIRVSTGTWLFLLESATSLGSYAILCSPASSKVPEVSSAAVDCLPRRLESPDDIVLLSYAKCLITTSCLGSTEKTQLLNTVKDDLLSLLKKPKGFSGHAHD